MSDTNQRIFQITGKIFSSPYDWGDNKLIPDILGFTPEPGIPYAEYWIGAHKRAPSPVEIDGQTKTLEALVTEQPETILGAEVAKKFHNELPFLFKLSNPKKMLSVQVHPNKKQAEEGFAEEEKTGVPATELSRTFKDPNSKTEMPLAIHDFWLLNGLRPVNEINELLETVVEFKPLAPLFENGNYRKLYEHVLKGMTDDEVNKILSPLVNRIVAKFEVGELEKTSHDYWVAKAVKDFDMHDGAYDRGIFSMYFLNLVHLKPNQALFQAAGVLHAFLEGEIVEIMQNSDNIARAGMTNKPIDFDYIMQFMVFDAQEPKVLDGRQDGEEVFYDVPAEEYLISRITPQNDKLYTQKSYSAEILMGTAGNAVIISNGKELSLGKGKSVVVFANTSYTINGAQNDVIYRLSVPHENNS